MHRPTQVLHLCLVPVLLVGCIRQYDDFRRHAGEDIEPDRIIDASSGEMTELGPKEGPRVEEAPDDACPGARVTLIGAGFGPTSEGATVSLNGDVISEFVDWQDDRLTFIVPDGAASGDLVVSVGGRESDPVVLNIRGTGRLVDMEEGPAEVVSDSFGVRHIVYLSTIGVLHRTLLDDQCWSDPPTVLAAGKDYSFGVRPGPSGKVHVVYAPGGGKICYYRGYNLTTPGLDPASWSEPVVFGEKRCSLGSLVVDSGGKLHAFWSGEDAQCYVQTLDEEHGSLTEPQFVMIGWGVRGTQSPADGRFHAITRTGSHVESPTEVRYASSPDGMAWSPQVPISSPFNTVGWGRIVATSDGRVHVLFQARNPDGDDDVYYVASEDGGDQWSNPTNISETSGTTLNWVELGIHLTEDEERFVVLWDDDFLSGAPTLFRRWSHGQFSPTHEFLTLGEDEERHSLLMAGLPEGGLLQLAIHRQDGAFEWRSLPLEWDDRQVFIPGGPATIGSQDSIGDDDEHPLHPVLLSPFFIDRFEVTVGEYRDCVSAGACTPPHLYSSHLQDRYWNAAGGLYDDHPVIHLDWNQASVYCQSAGKRLPTEAEWEVSARGSWATTYPWGDAEPDCGMANYYGAPGGVDAPCTSDTVPSDSVAGGLSLTGLFHLSGNVAEWVGDWYAADYYGQSPEPDPPGPEEGIAKVIRGGSWFSPPSAIRAAVRSFMLPDSFSNDVGFRCARSIEP